MATSICMPEEFKLVSGTKGPVTTNGGVTCDYVNLKNAVRCTVEVDLTQAVAHATAITIEQATTVAGGGTTAITNVVPIWQNAAVSTTSDTLVRATDAVSLSVAADIAKKKVIFQVDPTTLADGFDCITCILSDSSQATNLVNVNYHIQTTRAQATPPSAIID